MIFLFCETYNERVNVQPYKQLQFSKQVIVSFLMKQNGIWMEYVVGKTADDFRFGTGIFEGCANDTLTGTTLMRF